MIYDTIQNAALYKGMHPNLDTAIDFLLTHDLEALPLGRTEIDGDNVFLNKMEAQTLPAKDKLFEMHKVYMDIQIDVRGSEGIETGEIRGFECPDFSAEKDVGFGDCRSVASCVLTPGSFTVCMAGEPHKPGITVSDDPNLVKCVLKVRA
jgi:YhcH/YjgK/YiaL family protein